MSKVGPERFNCAYGLAKEKRFEQVGRLADGRLADLQFEQNSILTDLANTQADIFAKTFS